MLYFIDFRANSDLRSNWPEIIRPNASATFQLPVVGYVGANTCAPNKVSHEAPIRLSALPHDNEAELPSPASRSASLAVR